MPVTVAVALQVCPTRSKNVKANVPLPVKVYQVALVPVSSSLPESVATTS